MLDGIIIFTPSPCKSVNASSTLSIAGKGGFRILAIAFGRLYKASFILVDFYPILGFLS